MRTPSLRFAGLVVALSMATSMSMPTTAAASGATAATEPVGPSLARPSMVSRQAAGVVLLGGARASGRLVAVGERGVVVLSDDDGRHWRQADMPTSVTLTAVRFADASHGIAVGHGGSVLATSDAGAHWTRQLDGRRAADLALRAAEAGGDARAIKAAKQLVADGPDKPLLDVLALDARRALVIGAYGLVFATEDGGFGWVSWADRLPNPKGLHLYAVRARGNRIVIAGEQGLVLKSDDGGHSFARVATPYAGSYFTLELPGDDEIVLAGLRGNVWRSVDGGAGWARVATPAPVSITGSVLRPDGSIAWVNQAGMLMTSRGSTLRAERTPPLPPLNAVMVRADGRLLALGVQGVVELGDAAAVAPATDVANAGAAR